ncbi:hypothetical protein SUGI_0578110 [Cryptomeria japonica]|nr:hypothetical protein SUGI_0578110 [Cryptomeria japonica]
MVIQSDGQHDVPMDENVEQANRHITGLVAQPEVQNDVLLDENVETNQHNTDLVAHSDSQNALIKDEDVERIEKEKEMVESSIPPPNDISKDVIGPVKLQNPLSKLVVDLSLEDLNTQVEVSDNMEQGFGNKVEDPHKQVEVSDLEQCISAQTNAEVGNKVDAIVDDCKARFEEQVVLSKDDDGTQNVIIAEKDESASHTEHVKPS